jgi:hypothetical protein
MFRIELENEFEADVFSDLLVDEGIPFTVVSNYSRAFDGLYQMTMGWGHIEIPEVYKDQAEELFRNYKNSLIE